MPMKIVVLLVLGLSSSAFARDLSSVDSLVSFQCSLTHAAGFTQLNYEASESGRVSGSRNAFIPVQYLVNSAGLYYGSSSPKSHISLSGGSLPMNQYLTMLFHRKITSGESSASGTLLLVSMGGSFFEPMLQSALPIGQVYCRSIVVK